MDFQKESMKSKIQVCIRVSPIDYDPNYRIMSYNNNTLTIRSQSGNGHDQYHFPHIFHATYTDGEIFSSVGFNIVDQAFSGINCALISYGAQSSGKSYTLFGDSNNLGLVGQILNNLAVKKNIFFPFFNYEFGIAIFQIKSGSVFDILNDTNVIGSLDKDNIWLPKDNILKFNDPHSLKNELSRILNIKYNSTIVVFITLKKINVATGISTESIIQVVDFYSEFLRDSLYTSLLSNSMLCTDTFMLEYINSINDTDANYSNSLYSSESPSIYKILFDNCINNNFSTYLFVHLKQNANSISDNLTFLDIADKYQQVVNTYHINYSQEENGQDTIRQSFLPETFNAPICDQKTYQDLYREYKNLRSQYDIMTSRLSTFSKEYTFSKDDEPLKIQCQKLEKELLDIKFRHYLSINTKNNSNFISFGQYNTSFAERKIDNSLDTLNISKSNNLLDRTCMILPDSIISNNESDVNDKRKNDNSDYPIIYLQNELLQLKEENSQLKTENEHLRKDLNDTKIELIQTHSELSGYYILTNKTNNVSNNDGNS